MLSAIDGFARYVLITTSRKYKDLKRQNANYEMYYKKEIILKIVSFVVIFGTIFFFVMIYL